MIIIQYKCMTREVYHGTIISLTMLWTLMTTKDHMHLTFHTCMKNGKHIVAWFWAIFCPILFTFCLLIACKIFWQQSQHTCIFAWFHARFMHYFQYGHNFSFLSFFRIQPNKMNINADFLPWHGFPSQVLACENDDAWQLVEILVALWLPVTVCPLHGLQSDEKASNEV